GVGMGLITSTKNVTQGLAMGVRDVGGDALTVVHRAVKGTVAGAVELGGTLPQWRIMPFVRSLRRRARPVATSVQQRKRPPRGRCRPLVNSAIQWLERPQRSWSVSSRV